MTLGVVRRVVLSVFLLPLVVAALGSASAQHAVISAMSAAERAELEPNELGVIPVLQYHLFTTDPAEENEFTRTIEDFRADFQWLYDHSFYVIPMADLVRNQISAPPGKHPVVLSFDDATPGQFRLIEQEDGNLLVDPNSAVGVMEEFYRKYDDFGRGGFFALLHFNCFGGDIEPDQAQYCGRKLEWLAQNGYEIGHHTWDHQDLLDISDEEFQYQIGELWQWIEENIPAEGARPSMLVMPYGNYPDRDLHQEQRRMMREGVPYEGEVYVLEAAFMVGAEPAPSPSSTEWDPIWIPRIQAFDEELEWWLPVMADGGVILYTSDGDPETVMVPDPLPGWLGGALDPELTAESGKTLIQYDPETGELVGAAAIDNSQAWRRSAAIPAV
ncbi:MAG TPA: polysaccharide deacetylase family protein [Thermomicrobiales bacterium]|nr:polysaccharide deacetylase family protein [Thermomicrobiales bacterium]